MLEHEVDTEKLEGQYEGDKTPRNIMQILTNIYNW